MINLAPWFYRNLLSENQLISPPEFFEVALINGKAHFEANIFLKENLRPEWVDSSDIYKNCDGSGASEFKNIAVYKAISESLERLAFYQLADSETSKYCFDINPTTTGMAAFPDFRITRSRVNARAEAVERWAIHEFNRSRLPILKHASNIKDLSHYEVVNPFDNVRVSLLAYKKENFYVYGFAGGDNLKHSFDKALIELDRNIRVLSKFNCIKQYDDFKSTVDRTLYFFSTEEGHNLFLEKIKSSPGKIANLNPKILCDMELKGEWSIYTKVWRYLLEDSYFEYKDDHTFFMF